MASPNDIPAFVRATRNRAYDLLNSLQQLDQSIHQSIHQSIQQTHNPAHNPAHGNQAINQSINQFQLVSAQIAALLDETHLTPLRQSINQLIGQSIKQLVDQSIVHPLIAGYNPSDQARIKLLPEDESVNQSILLQFYESEYPINQSTDQSTTPSTNQPTKLPFTHTELENRIQAYNQICQSIKRPEPIDDQSITQSITQSTKQRREAEDAEIKRALRTMYGGRGVRIE